MTGVTDYVEVCPKCGSPDWHIENQAVWGGDTGFYVCNKCGNSSKIFPQVKVDKLGKFGKEAKRMAKQEKHVPESKPFFNWADSLALALGILFIFIVGVTAFLVIVGGYFTLKALFRKRNN